MLDRQRAISELKRRGLSEEAATQQVDNFLMKALRERGFSEDMAIKLLNSYIAHEEVQRLWRDQLLKEIEDLMAASILSRVNRDGTT